MYMNGTSSRWTIPPHTCPTIDPVISQLEDALGWVDDIEKLAHTFEQSIETEEVLDIACEIKWARNAINEAIGNLDKTLRDQNADLRHAIQQAENDMDSAEATIDARDEEISSLKDEIEELKEQLEQMKHLEAA